VKLPKKTHITRHVINRENKIAMKKTRKNKPGICLQGRNSLMLQIVIREQSSLLYENDIFNNDCQITRIMQLLPD